MNSTGASFAISVPSRNQGGYIRQCLDSIVVEPGASVFVADALSSDATVDVLSSYGDRIAWRSERDAGQADAINKGFAELDGDIMGYMNCDDMYLPGALARVAAAFEDPAVDIVAGGALNLHGEMPGGTWGPAANDWQDLCWLPVAFEPATFWRRRVWEAEGPFDTSYHYVFGWDFLCRASKRFHAVTIAEPLAANRLHGERKTATGGERRRDEILGLVRRHGTPEQVRKYESVAAAPARDWAWWPDMRPARLRPLAYRVMQPHLARELGYDEALRIFRVLRGR